MPNTKNNSLNSDNLEKVGGGEGKSDSEFLNAGFGTPYEGNVSIYIKSPQGAHSDKAREYSMDQRAVETIIDKGYKLDQEILNSANDIRN